VTSPSPRPESRARDHLANERTYLAWLRTALAVVALGAVLARAGDGATVVAAAGITVALGIAAIVYATAEFYRVSRDLEAGRFEPKRRGPVVVAGIVIAGVAVVFPLLLV
jgi:putative membrane protein